METLRRLRSAASLVLALSWFVPAAVWVHLIVLPAARLFPGRRRAWMEAFIFRMARVLLWSMRAGGATFRVTGRIPTDAPCLIVGNHQSLLDPAIVIGRLAHPYVPAFVARARYASVPVVAASMRAVGCPIIDPTRDARGAVATIAEAARQLPHGLIIYPEGHRTRDGNLLPFRVAGMNAILAARRVPVYLVVSDGLWVNRTLVDVLFNVHRMRGAIEVLGPFDPPADAADIPAFVDGVRDRMEAHLAAMRARGDERAA
jgi:1-acyl-sn-glycerol-3-phosphate acyltransferase